MNSLSGLLFRSGVGGVFMGLANLVPGISGGTMLLAAGIYTQFIEAIANFTSFRFKKNDILMLLGVVGAAGLSILVFAGIVRDLVVTHRWAMYSLFIGLTLGGVPILLSLIEDMKKKHYLFVALGLLTMVAVAYFQVNQVGTDQGQGSAGFLLMFVAGLAGASAMILPGVSGGYLLLVLGCYLPILSGIDAIKVALGTQNIEALWDPVQSVVIPVGIGVVSGVVVVSHALKWCLQHFEKETYAVLLGLLFGAIFGLWPFQANLPLVEIDIVKGQAVEVINDVLTYQVSGLPVKLKDIPTTFAWPSIGETMMSLLIVILGFMVTLGISKFGERKDKIS